MKSTKNHITVANAIAVDSKPVSRNRVRIPTRSLRHLNVKPGQRVQVAYSALGMDVEIRPNPKGNYKVEKDGSVRFPAHKFGIDPKEFTSTADTVERAVFVF